jgi:hypothetical protein
MGWKTSNLGSSCEFCFLLYVISCSDSGYISRLLLMLVNSMTAKLALKRCSTFCAKSFEDVWPFVGANPSVTSIGHASLASMQMEFWQGCDEVILSVPSLVM